MIYTRFNRHESMSEDTLSEILSIIKDVSLSKEIEENLAHKIENMLYGLFDGYLYEELQLLALKLPTVFAQRIMRIFDICNRYTKIA